MKIAAAAAAAAQTICQKNNIKLNLRRSEFTNVLQFMIWLLLDKEKSNFVTSDL